MKSYSRHVVTTGVVIGALAIGAGIFVWSGMYNIGADEPHWMPTRVVIDKLREQSISARMADVQVPNLDDPKVIAAGAINYSAMCTGCHLAPGVTDTEIRPGLYPMPPDLPKVGSEDDKRTFWIIKHGIKMTAMPAWGKTHTDQQIWNMVAFIRKLPGMTPERYAALGGKPPAEDEDHMHAGGGDARGAMAGMDMKSPEEAPAHDHQQGQPHSHDAKPVTAPSLAGLQPKAAAAAEAVAEAFHAALKQGDRKAALALLASDVTISEGGATQTREQYASAHLAQDIAFLKTARIKPVSIGSMPMGETAMVGSRNEMHATHDGKPIGLLSTEMLTLRRAPSGWLITKIEWASGPLPK